MLRIVEESSKVCNIFRFACTLCAIMFKTHIPLCPQALLQMVQSHDGSIKSVVEKGDALLASVHYPPIRDKINRLKKDYADLCNSALVRNCHHR